MDYNDVPLFVRVVEAGSFSSAADTLGLQKSTVSRNVARLEADLGVRLLQRTTRKLALTESGKAFYERVRSAVSGLDEAAGAAQVLGGEPQGIVRLTAPPDADSSSLGVATAIAKFVERYPKIHVELSLSTRRVDLVAEGFDLAVRAGKLADSTLIARKVGSTRFGFFASPAYLARRGTPKTVADLATHDCVLFRGHGGRAMWTVKGPKGDELVEVKGPVSADDLSFVARCALAGLGIALLPIAVALEPTRAGNLVMVLKEYGIEGSSLHVVLPSASFVPTRVALLRDFLVEYLSKEMAALEAQCGKHKEAERAAKPAAAAKRVQKKPPPAVGRR